MFLKENEDNSEIKDQITLPNEKESQFITATSCSVIHGTESEAINMYERKVHAAVINILTELGYSGDLLINWLIATPLKGLRNKYREAFKSLRSHRNLKYSLRRPDIFLMSLGIAIEVDGDIHESNPQKVLRDDLAPVELATMRTCIFRITNYEAANSERFGVRLKELRQLISEKMNEPNKNQDAKFRRNKFSRTLTKCHRSDSIAFHRAYRKRGKVPSHPQISCRVENGGYRVIIRPSK